MKGEEVVGAERVPESRCCRAAGLECRLGGGGEGERTGREGEAVCVCGRKMAVI